MKLAWILFKKSIRSNLGRLLLIGATVALGVAMLVVYTSFHNAIFQNPSYGFTESISDAYGESMKSPSNGAERDGIKPLWIKRETGGALLKYQDDRIEQYLVERGDSNIENMLDLAVPNNGEYYLSPALKQIVDKHPEMEIQKRFGKIYKGEIPHDMVYGKDSLVVISGVDNLHSEPDSGAFPVYKFHRSNAGNVLPKLISKVFYLGILIVLFPVIMLLIVAAQLGGVQREQRYAALRLGGATGRQIATISLFESAAAAAIGTIGGVVIGTALRPALSNFTLSDSRYFPEQLTLSWQQYLIIIAITFGAVIFANARGLRRLFTSPLGVARQSKKSPRPHFWRLFPLLGGMGASTFLVYKAPQSTNDRYLVAFLASIMVVMIGLVIASPYLTFLIAKLRSLRTRSTEVYIGENYVQAHAQRISRSIVGVVLALFAGSFFLTGISGYEAIDAKDQVDYYLKNTSVTLFVSDPNPAVSDNVTQQILAKDYINSAAKAESIQRTYTFFKCTDALPYLEDFSCDGEYALLHFHAPKSEAGAIGKGSRTELLNVYDEENSTPGYLLSLQKASDIEKLRSDLAELLPSTAQVTMDYRPNYDGNVYSSSTRMLVYLTYTGLAVTLIVAIISLTVSTYASIIERQRSLLTLRLAGMEPRRLRRMVLVESFSPLAAISIISAGSGVLLGYLLINNFSSSMQAQISGIYLAVLSGALAASALIIWLISATVGKVTQLSVNRME